jgi:hypothetical protein
VKLTTNFHLVLRSTRGAIPPLPIRIHGVVLSSKRKQRDTFTFYLFPYSLGLRTFRSPVYKLQILITDHLHAALLTYSTGYNLSTHNIKIHEMACHSFPLYIQHPFGALGGGGGDDKDQQPRTNQPMNPTHQQTPPTLQPQFPDLHINFPALGLLL